MCPNQNAVRACAGTVECRADFYHGLLCRNVPNRSENEGQPRWLQTGLRPNDNEVNYA